MFLKLSSYNRSMFPKYGLCWFAEPMEEVVVDDVVSAPIVGQDQQTDADKQAKKPEDDLEVIVEGQEPPAADTGDQTPDELIKLQSEVTALQKKIQDGEQRELTLAQQLHDAKKAPVAVQPEKKQSDEPEKYTRAQLVNLIKEYKDDPEAMFSIYQEIARQEAAGIRDKTMEDVDQRTWHNNLSSIENRAISEDPILSKRPDIVEKLPQMASALRLDKHPFGRYLAYLAYKAGNDVESDPAKDAAAEANRVKDLETKKGADKTKVPGKKQVTLTQQHLDVAEKFSLNPKFYAKFVSQSKETN